jgi:hypothetical protein
LHHQHKDFDNVANVADVRLLYLAGSVSWLRILRLWQQQEGWRNGSLLGESDVEHDGCGSGVPLIV